MEELDAPINSLDLYPLKFNFCPTLDAFFYWSALEKTACLTLTATQKQDLFHSLLPNIPTALS